MVDQAPSAALIGSWGDAALAAICMRPQEQPELLGPFPEASVARTFGGHPDNGITMAIVFLVPPSRRPQSSVLDVRIHCFRMKSGSLTYLVK